MENVGTLSPKCNIGFDARSNWRLLSRQDFKLPSPTTEKSVRSAPFLYLLAGAEYFTTNSSMTSFCMNGSSLRRNCR